MHPAHFKFVLKRKVFIAPQFFDAEIHLFIFLFFNGQI